MADTKISNLTDGNPPQDADIFPVARGAANRRFTWANIKSAISSLFLLADGTVTGATAQAQAFTNGVKTQEIKDSSNVSAIAVDARVLRDAAGNNNVDFSAIPLFFQDLSTNKIINTNTDIFDFTTVQPAVTTPAGGAVQDAESRTSIGEIKAILAAYGLTS